MKRTSSSSQLLTLRVKTSRFYSLMLKVPSGPGEQGCRFWTVRPATCLMCGLDTFTSLVSGSSPVNDKLAIYKVLLLARSIDCFVYPMNVCVKSHQSCLCLILRNPTDLSSPGSCFHGILQARILEWMAMPVSRASSQPRGRALTSYVSCVGRWNLYC